MHWDMYNIHTGIPGAFWSVDIDIHVSIISMSDRVMTRESVHSLNNENTNIQFAA